MKSVIAVTVFAVCAQFVPSASLALADEAAGLRQTVKTQEATIKRLEGTIEHLQTTLDGVTPTAVVAPFGRFLIVQGNTHVLALQFYEHAESKNGLVSKYRWVLQEDGSFNFSKPSVKRGQAELVEVYGNATIQHGGFKLQWSHGGFIGDWIYYPYGRPDIKFRPTELTRIEDVRLVEGHWPIRVTRR